jgi:hypothetical protein
MMRWANVAVLGTLLGLAGSPLAGLDAAAQIAPSSDPQAAAAVDRAGRALQALQAGLLTRLRQAMEQGGPRKAIDVCRNEAQVISKRVSAEQGITIGRTSHRLRNPVTAPPAWARDIVEAAAGRQAADVEPQVIDLGNRYGVLRPIGTAETCTRCHGPSDAVRREIGDLLSQSYPSDQAVGFAVGDLRGWGWAEVPKTPRPH